MSLYNMMFGENPAADIFLGLLGCTRDDFYRYRDCYLVEDEGENQIGVHTRGGGNNRECYCEEYGSESERTEVDADGHLHMPSCVVLAQEEVAKHPNFLHSQDDDFDNTYETTYFSISDSGLKVLDTLRDMQTVKRNPKELWDRLLTGLRDKNSDDPMVKNAIEVGKKIFGAVEAFTKEGKSGIVEV
jgi:hypothetical protein